MKNLYHFALSFVIWAIAFNTVCFAEQLPKLKQENVDPEQVKVVCEHLGTAWLICLSASIVVACAWKHGIFRAHRAPKCAIGAVVGGVSLVAGIGCQNDWVIAIGGIIVIASHVCECSAITIGHMRTLLSDDTNRPVRDD